MKLSEKEKQLRDDIAKELFIKLDLTNLTNSSYEDAITAFERAKDFIEKQREIHEQDKKEPNWLNED